jgi:hypothetical protein
MTKTGAGTAGPIVNLYWGTTGTTSDTQIVSQQFGAGTVNADSGIFVVYVVFGVAGGSATVGMSVECRHSLAATGLTTTGAAGVALVVGASQSGTFNSTGTSNYMSVAFNGGTSFAGTVQQVQAEAYNIP